LNKYGKEITVAKNSMKTLHSVIARWTSKDEGKLGKSANRKGMRARTKNTKGTVQIRVTIYWAGCGWERKGRSRRGTRTGMTTDIAITTKGTTTWTAATVKMVRTMLVVAVVEKDWIKDSRDRRVIKMIVRKRWQGVAKGERVVIQELEQWEWEIRNKNKICY
jgi:hypothetical protein